MPFCNDSDDSAKTFGDTIKGDGEPSDDLLAEAQSAHLRQQAIAEAMAKLTPRQAFVVTRRYMIDEPDSLAEVGQALGVSREYARQLEVKALKILGKHIDIKRLDK